MGGCGVLMSWWYGVNGGDDLVTVKGVVVGIRSTDKGSRILSVADEKAVHQVLVSEDFVWGDELKGKDVEVSGICNDGVFMFARGNGKKR